MSDKCARTIGNTTPLPILACEMQCLQLVNRLDELEVSVPIFSLKGGHSL